MPGTSIGFGVGQTFRGSSVSSSTSSGIVQSLLPLGALLTSFGDGITAEGSAAGIRNAVTLALMAMAGRVLPTENHNMARSGDSFAIGAARLPYAVAQQPNIFVGNTRGHNDALMTTDPTSAPGIALMDSWEADNAYILANATSQKIILTTTVGSIVTGESSYAAAVNAIQLAKIATHMAADSRVVLWDAWPLYNHTNASNLSPSSDAGRVHPDDRGAWQLAFGDGTHDGLYDVLDSIVQPATKDEIFTYLSALATNFDADYTLSGGTGGTKAGTIAPTGNWPTGKRITNNLTNGTSVAVTCSIVDQTGYKEAKAVISGTPAATNTIVFDDTANISATGTTPGQMVLQAMGVKFDDGAGGAPVGILNWSMQWGNFGQICNSTDQTSVLTNGQNHLFDAVFVTNPNPGFASGGPYSANPQLTVRFKAVAQTSAVTIQRPMLFTPYAVARARPSPIWKAPGESANYLQRLTASSFTNGQTWRAEPGRWSGGGLSNATITHRKIFETLTNAGADAIEGAGTQMVDMTGSTFTWVASGTTPGRFAWLDVHIDNGIGGEVVARSGPYTIV